MSTPADVRHADPARLSAILSFDGPECPWQSGELEAVLQHQLASPLEFALADVSAAAAAPQELPASEASSQPLPRNLADLLHHPRPPLALVKTLKEFAKSHAYEPRSPLPREIAMLLYYAAIVVARMRCGDAHITDLSDADLCRGIEGVLISHWIDEDTRRLLETGRDCLKRTPDAA